MKQLTPADFLTHPKILGKAEEELKFCDEPGKSAQDLISDCLLELEEKGFLNLVGDQVRAYVVQISDQKKKLRAYISNQLRSSTGSRAGMHFDYLYKAVCQQFDNFYTKEFVFKVIDELFQMGLIYETGKCQYAFLENQM